MTVNIRLGPLPKNKMLKLTITVSAQLKGALDRYAELHAQTWGEKIDVPTLIPHMLEAFIARDRAFARANRATLVR